MRRMEGVTAADVTRCETVDIFSLSALSYDNTSIQLCGEYH